MIDYISTTTSFDGKDNIFLAHLQEDAAYKSGWMKYTLQGCERLAVWLNHSLQLMRLEGSISYYCQGSPVDRAEALSLC